MKKPTCEEIIDEIKALFAPFMPDAWIEVEITSWKEFDEQINLPPVTLDLRQELYLSF